jgi:diadenosine tetraphosphate (Ap4A) HIT family hydrolase
MCEQGRPDDNEHGLRFYTGEYSDAYVQRLDFQRGYSISVWRGRHVSEPTQLSEDEADGYWREVLIAGRAIERHFSPLKMNYQMLGNSLPHLHTHIVPRYEVDDAPGGPLRFPEPGSRGKRHEPEVEEDAEALRKFVGGAS